MQDGESVQVQGGYAKVLNVVETEQEEPVYTIEVDADHCYRIGQQGLLVHNASYQSACSVDPNDRAKQKSFLSQALKALCPSIFAQQQTIAIALVTDNDGCSLRCVATIGYNQDDLTDPKRTSAITTTLEKLRNVCKAWGIDFDITTVPNEVYYHAEAQLIEIANNHNPKSKICVVIVSRQVCSSTTPTKNKPDTSCAKRITWIQNTKCAGLPFEIWAENCPNTQ